MFVGASNKMNSLPEDKGGKVLALRLQPFNKRRRNGGASRVKTTLRGASPKLRPPSIVVPSGTVVGSNGT